MSPGDIVSPGDINGDGFDDLLFETWWYEDVNYSWDRTCREYVVYGTDVWPEPISLKSNMQSPADDTMA